MPDLAVLDETTWFALEGEQATDLLEADPTTGLTTKEASSRLQAFGPNELTAEPPPSKLEIAKNQIVDPMNLMLIGVAVVSIIIGEFGTGVLVATLVLLNVSLGARQELKAREAIDALAQLQVPKVRVLKNF